VLSFTYQSTARPLLSTLYEPLPKHLISVLGGRDASPVRRVACVCALHAGRRFRVHAVLDMTAMAPGTAADQAPCQAPVALAAV
jgi:hypothetical protein